MNILLIIILYFPLNISTNYFLLTISSGFVDWWTKFIKNISSSTSHKKNPSKIHQKIQNP